MNGHDGYICDDVTDSDFSKATYVWVHFVHKDLLHHLQQLLRWQESLSIFFSVVPLKIVVELCAI